jgi:hypothetical protein
MDKTFYKTHLLRFILFGDWKSCSLVGRTNIAQEAAAPVFTLRRFLCFEDSAVGSCDKIIPSTK